VIALWYPILTGAPHRPMIGALQSAMPDAMTHEVAFPPAREGHRMIGSGMFIVNPPFGLAEEGSWLSKQFTKLRG